MYSNIRGFLDQRKKDTQIVIASESRNLITVYGTDPGFLILYRIPRLNKNKSKRSMDNISRPCAMVEVDQNEFLYFWKGR